MDLDFAGGIGGGIGGGEGRLIEVEGILMGMGGVGALGKLEGAGGKGRANIPFE